MDSGCARLLVYAPQTAEPSKLIHPNGSIPKSKAFLSLGLERNSLSSKEGSQHAEETLSDSQVQAPRFDLPALKDEATAMAVVVIFGLRFGWLRVVS